MVTNKQLVHITESAIDNLITTFKTIPYFFYTENDLHCNLYHEIYSKLPPEKWQCETKDKKKSILLHKEYPTKERYSRKRLAVNPKGKRGHFDLCIWNPRTVRDKLFRARRTMDIPREQQTFIVIEFDLIEHIDSFRNAMHHIQWDFKKLTDEINKVEYCYLLVFVRDWRHRDLFLQRIP